MPFNNVSNNITPDNCIKIMIDITISIIIPIYNVKDYIVNCLKSVLEQNYKNLEIILIDDCGNDNSIKIAEEIIKKYSSYEVTIIKHKKNKGLSAARNTGVQQAKGDYILFLDSDDYLTPNAISHLVKYLKKYPNTDFIIGGTETVGLKNIKIPLLCKEYTNNKKGIITSYLNREWNIMAWNKLIKKEFFINNNLWFKEGVFHEDIDFTFRLAHSANSFACCHNVTYKYLIRQGSITTHKVTKNYIDEKNILIHNFKELSNDIKLGIKEHQIGNYITYTCFNYIYNIVLDKNLPHIYKKEYINDILNNRGNTIFKYPCTGKNKLISHILNYNLSIIFLFSYIIFLSRKLRSLFKKKS